MDPIVSILIAIAVALAVYGIWLMIKHSGSDISTPSMPPPPPRDIDWKEERIGLHPTRSRFPRPPPPPPGRRVGGYSVRPAPPPVVLVETSRSGVDPLIAGVVGYAIGASQSHARTAVEAPQAQIFDPQRTPRSDETIESLQVMEEPERREIAAASDFTPSSSASEYTPSVDSSSYTDSGGSSGSAD